MLLPFLAFPEKVRGRNVVFRIDNMAVLFGWYHGFVKNDKSASEILKCIHYLSGINGTVVNVDHVDRVSGRRFVQKGSERRREGMSRSPESGEGIRDWIAS